MGARSQLLQQLDNSVAEVAFTSSELTLLLYFMNSSGGWNTTTSLRSYGLYRWDTCSIMYTCRNDVCNDVFFMNKVNIRLHLSSRFVV
jgi:hypothetical protein